MVITKREDVTKQGFCKILWRKLLLWGSLLLELIQFRGDGGEVGGVGVGALSSLSGIGREVGWGGPLFEAGRLLNFSAFRMGAYSRWALIRGWSLIRINTVGASIEYINKILQLQIANYRLVFKPTGEKFKGPHGNAEWYRMFFFNIDWKQTVHKVPP